MIEFHLDARSGVSPYRQIVDQVRRALRLAYKELEHAGLVAARPGVGTFVTAQVHDDTFAAHGPLRRDLVRWLDKARLAGLDEESIEALFRDALAEDRTRGVA